MLKFDDAQGQAKDIGDTSNLAAARYMQRQQQKEKDEMEKQQQKEKGAMEKKEKKLLRTLRQIDEIKAKKTAGLPLEKTQVNKVERESIVRAELAELIRRRM